MIERESRLCPKCASRSPFGFKCPNCYSAIVRGNAVCSGCGRPLTTLCFHCGQPTFVGADRCDSCGQSLMIRCENKRCGELQFFELTKCTICGKDIKKAQKQIRNMQKGAY
jgi:hypothetical protein